MQRIDDITRHFLDVILHDSSVLLTWLPASVEEARDPRPPECLHEAALAALPDFTGNVKQGGLDNGLALQLSWILLLYLEHEHKGHPLIE